MNPEPHKPGCSLVMSLQSAKKEQFRQVINYLAVRAEASYKVRLLAVLGETEHRRDKHIYQTMLRKRVGWIKSKYFDFLDKKQQKKVKEYM